MQRASGWGSVTLLAGSPDLNAWWDRMLYLYCWALEGVYNPVTIECVTAYVP